MKISFIGLGQMGKGMVLNLAKAECELLAYDIDDSAFSILNENNIKTTIDIRETIDSDIIFLCLPNEKVVEKVLFGENGIVDSLTKCKVIADCSTINYMSALSISRRVNEAGIEFMDAPVSGMQSKAEDGTLAIMCGGKRDIFDYLKPYFDHMGSKIIYMGKTGNGQLTKMINNSIYDINCIAMSELLSMAVKLGLEPKKIGDVVNSGTGRSYASEYFVPKILERDFSYGFTLENAYKDLVSAVETAVNNSIPTPVLDAATSIYKMTMLKGYGDLYKGALMCFYEDTLGIKFK